MNTTELLAPSAERPINRKLISFAYLAQATRSEDDLLSGITSIFKPIAKVKAGQIFNPAEFCETINEMYGLKIHPWAAEDLIPRLVANEVIIEQKVSDDVKQYIYAEINEDFLSITEQDINSVVYQFIEYCKPILETHESHIDEDELGSKFLDHLVDLNFISVALRPTDHKISDIEKITLDSDKKKWKEDVQVTARMNTLCASFIINSYHNNTVLYDLIVQIVSGALASEVILNFQEPAKDVDLSGINIVLDTPFLMAYLNLSCEKEHIFSDDLCSLLIDKNAQISVFQHSVDELKDNLNGVINNFKQDKAFGATGRRLRQKTFNQYLKQVLKNTETALRQKGVRILKNLKSEGSFKIFTQDQEDSLCNSFGYYTNRLAQERDALSIALTMRYRNNIKFTTKEYYKTKYIFLTENSFIPDTSQKFMVRNNLLNTDHVPPAFSGRYLSGLIWMLFGAKGKDLSKELLLANCSAALEPNSDLVNKMHSFLDEIDPSQADLFDALMGDERAGQYLMGESLGDTSLLTPENTSEILEKVKLSLTESIEQQKQAEIKSIKESHKEELNKLKETISEAENKAKKIGKEKIKIHSSVNTLKDENNNLQMKFEKARKREINEYESAINNQISLSITAAKYFTIFSAIVIASFLAIISYLFINNETGMYLSISTTFIVVFLSFWKIPDIIFGSLIKKFRQYHLDLFLNLKGKTLNENLYKIDWKNKVIVRIKKTK